MNIQELFEYILTEGCGVTLASIMQSRKYKSLLNKQENLFVKYPATTDEGALLRVGHLIGGKLLNCYSENEAVQKTNSISSKYGHGIEMRALITATGDAIIQAAKKNLPEEALAIASKWKSASADEQITLTHELYHLFTTEDQRKKSEVQSSNLWRLIQESDQMKDQQRGPISVLPKKYGKWNRQNNVANCQGKTQLLVAFAQIVGAPVMIMAPNVIARDTLDTVKTQMAQRIEKDITDRNIAFPDPQFMDSLQSGMIKNMFQEGRDRSFHVCPVIQVKDGRWVVIDSNSLNWGILGSEWNIDSVYSQLIKYGEVLPGLSIGAADYKQHKEAIRMIIEKVDAYLLRSKEMQVLLDSTDDLMTTVEAFADSAEFVRLIEEVFEGSIPVNADRIIKINLAIDILYGSSDDLLDRVLDDPDFLQKKKDCLLTCYHCLALDSVNDSYNDNGHIIHPEAHFSVNAGYDIALSALNSVGLDHEVQGLTNFIADYCFCQTTLHNAMIGRNSPHDLKLAATQVLEQLPYTHQLSKRFLSKK